MDTEMMKQFESMDRFVSLSEQELLTVEGGKSRTKKPWYQLIIDFGQGFLDAF